MKKKKAKDMLGKKCTYCKKDVYILKASMLVDDSLVCPSCFHDRSRYKAT